MIPNMSGVYAATIATLQRQRKREHDECEERYKRVEDMICRKTIPCKWCLEDFEESCPKMKVTK